MKKKNQDDVDLLTIASDGWKKISETLKIQNKELERQIEELKKRVVVWHDLELNPNDLPENNSVVMNQIGEKTKYSKDYGFLGFGGVNVTAWCEIPFYKKI